MPQRRLNHTLSTHCWGRDVSMGGAAPCRGEQQIRSLFCQWVDIRAVSDCLTALEDA